MSAAQSSSAPGEKPQYHHFIPQFILRNYAHPYRPPSGAKGTKRHSNRKGSQRKAEHIRPGDLVLHSIDLSSTQAKLTESPIRRTFGLKDMYRDMAKASNQNYVEEELSKLESNAAMIISKIRKTFDANNQAVWLSRQERDILRKFLFIMKYRGKAFHKRFVGDDNNKEGYVEDDKEKFLKYMHEKGFRKAVDVWLHSIMVILKLNIDLEGKWMKKVMEQIYPDDAMWFIMHMEGMYLTLCTPADTNMEFLLTENCYNVFEGPQTTLRDPATGEKRCVAWTNFHEFSPISPKLMIVLRSFILPNSEEDMDERIKRWRENIYKICTAPYPDPPTANSILADLPVRKARNSYSFMSSHRIELLEGEDGSRRSYHRFCFPFFKLSSEHVNKINTILLENAYTCQTVAFASQSALKVALEYYMTFPVGQGFKLVGDRENDHRLLYLLKLENILRELGSDKALAYQFANAKLIDDGAFEIMTDKLAEYLPKQPTGFMQLYMKLGGSAATLVRDLEQHRRMINMRIKIDVWTKGLEENKRNDIREKLRDHFCQFVPARRMWWYLKKLRLMSLKEPEALSDSNDDIQEFMEGPEDVIVKASHVIHTKNLGRLMHFAVLKHIFLLKNPGSDLQANITRDEAGAMRLFQMTHFAFGSASNICECGIDKIQERAKSVATMLQLTQGHKKWYNPFWTDSQNIEICTRFLVREDVGKLLGDQLSSETLQELKEVLFNIIYPTYAKRGETK